MFIRIIHGFTEGENSDIAGLHTLAADLHLKYPQANISEHTQEKFDALPVESDKEICIANSWGLSAAIRRADKNPDARFPLIIGLDGVANPFNEPKQDKDKEWTRRKNIGHLVMFREQDSILAGSPIRPENLQMWTGFRDDQNKFTQFEYGWATEVILDKEYGPLGNFGSHFSILTAHKYVSQMVMERIAKAVQEWKP